MPSRLIDQLFAEPYRFEFAQAVRLLQRWGRATGGAARDASRREVVRFVVHQTLRFPASAIHALEPMAAPSGQDVRRAVMTVAFLGLTGPKGVLPIHYTTHLRQQIRQGDRLSAAFFDLFNHRLISLFARAGEKYRVDRDDGTGPDRGPVADVLLALAGLGPAGSATRNRLPLADRRLLRCVGHLQRTAQTAEGLVNLIGEVIGLDVVVEPFVPRWVAIGAEHRSRIGRSGQNNALGQGCVIGQRIRDHQGKFRVRVGPLTLARFRRLLPGTPALRELVGLIRLYVGAELVFDVVLVLRADEVPRSRLGGGSDDGPALGRMTWAAAGSVRADQAVVVARVDWTDRPGSLR